MSERFANEIRKAIESSGLTRYRIAREISVSEALLSRFMAGKGGIGLETVNRLADLLGLHVVIKAKRRSSRKGR